MPRIVIVGADGMLVTAVRQVLAADASLQIISLGEAQLDITNAAAVRAALEQHKPDWVINGAAFLNADRCDKEPQTSYKVNYQAAIDLGEAARAVNARLVHFSTDFVFDGKTGNYSEADCGLPISYYGLHKYMADQYFLATQAPVHMLRIASVIGAGEGKRDFLKAVLGRVAGGAAKCQVVGDLKISMVTTQLVARTIAALIAKRPAFGVLNTVADGETTWFDIARVAFDALGIRIPVEPVPSSTYPTPALRPLHSSLQNDKLHALLSDVPHWEAALRAQLTTNRDTYLAAAQPQPGKAA